MSEFIAHVGTKVDVGAARVYAPRNFPRLELVSRRLALAEAEPRP
jgi:hypothetical protein